VAQRIGLGKEANRASYVIGDLARELLKKSRYDNEKKNYSNIIKLIPDTISSILDEDYKKTLDFSIQKRIMIRPSC
jgi:hypothetical protein